MAFSTTGPSGLCCWRASPCLHMSVCCFFFLVFFFFFFLSDLNSGARRTTQLAHRTSAPFSLTALIRVWFFLIPETAEFLSVFPPLDPHPRITVNNKKKTYYIKIHLCRGGVCASYRPITGPEYVFSAKEKKKSAAGKTNSRLKRRSAVNQNIYKSF